MKEWIDQLQTLSVSSTQRLVGRILMDYYVDESELCFPSQDRIAKDAGLSRKAVSGAIKALTESGVLRMTKRRSKGRKWDNNYYELLLLDEDKDYTKAPSYSNDWRVDVEDVIDFEDIGPYSYVTLGGINKEGQTVDTTDIDIGFSTNDYMKLPDGSFRSGKKLYADYLEDSRVTLGCINK